MLSEKINKMETEKETGWPWFEPLPAQEERFVNISTEFVYVTDTSDGGCYFDILVHELLIDIVYVQELSFKQECYHSNVHVHVRVEGAKECNRGR